MGDAPPAIPLTAASLSVALAMAVQLGAIVWMAANLSSAVRELRRLVIQLRKWISGLDALVADHETRLTVLEDRERRKRRKLGEEVT